MSQSQVSPEDLLANQYIWRPIKVILQAFFENGATIEEVFYGADRTDIYTLIKYKGTLIPLRFFGERYFLPFNSTLSSSIAADKSVFHEIVNRSNLPAPKSLLYRDEAHLRQSLEQFKTVVVKPARGAHGDGISMDITTLDELKKAVEHASDFDNKVILQPQLSGDDYRLLFVNYKLTAALRRHRAFVVGDGSSTIKQLIEAENAKRISVAKDDSQKTPLSGWRANAYFEISAEAVSRKRGEDFMGRIPAAKEKVVLLSEANIGLGGVSEDVTSLVSSDFANACSKFLRSIGLKFGGVDVISKDISSPLESSLSFVLEINAQPGLIPHIRPEIGQPQPVGDVIAEEIYSGLRKVK